MAYNTTAERPVQLILPTGQDVKKSNQIVRARVRCDNKSVYVGRILAGLISCIRVDDTQFADTYNISARDLANGNRDEYVRIRNACKSLVTARAEIDTISTDTGEPGFILINFIEKIEYKNGIISAIFTRSAGPYLLQLKNGFTVYKLIEYLRLSTSYSQRLFEILKSWSGATHPVKIDINELQDNMDVPISMRRNYRDFRAILEPACKEITTKTELRYTWRPIKKGGQQSKTGKVYAIEFTIKDTKRKNKIEQNIIKNEGKYHQLATACAMQIGDYGTCYEDRDDQNVCEYCKRHNIFTGHKNPISQYRNNG